MNQEIIQVNTTNTYQYFRDEDIDEIFESMQKEITQNIKMLPNQGVGCMVFPEIQIKELGKMNVFIEYNFEIHDRNFTKPVSIKVHPHDVKIFKGMPQLITNRIEEIKKIISDYSSQN